MKVIFSIMLISLFSTFSHADTVMKHEGTCKGTLKDGSEIKFTYFSSFNGCINKSMAAISFAPEADLGLYTGKRVLHNEKDTYTFSVKENGKVREAYTVTFADSTGNTEGVMTYLNQEQRKETIKVLCDIRDYEYADCTR